MSRPAILMWGFAGNSFAFPHHKQQGTTVLMATHDRGLIEQHHYREIVLSRGELLKGGDASVKLKMERTLS